MAKETPIITHLLQEVVVHIENLYSDYKVTKPECTIISRLKDYLNGMEAGAISAGTHFAEKLHQANQEIAILQQWKAEASELLNPILDYGQSKEADIPLGASVTSVVLERCKKYKEARDLLGIFIKRHEAGLLPDRFIYNDIKQFLDGTK